MMVLVALGVVLGSRLAQAQAPDTKPDAVTAIDILLEPDATMIEHAKADNARLLKVYPKGFGLDATHHPHITLLQRYVRTADLDKVYAAAGKVLAGEKVTTWKLQAFRYYYIPSEEIGVAGIVIRPTSDLLRLQQKLIDAVAPFTAPTGTAAAYVSPEDPDVDSALIDYVATFVPKRTGTNFNPHVTIGTASQVYLDGMLAEPLEAFTFSPVAVSVYQLGSFGTAQKKLKTWS
jgi:2'-5' RNA ligase